MVNKKSENFKRLAEARTNKVINGIALIGNLSNTSHYEYTDEQVESMFAAIQSEIEVQKERFSQKPSKKKFRL